MRKTFVQFALAVALTLLALPVAASPAVDSVSPGSVWSSSVAKVLDVFAGLWSVGAPEVTASPASEAQAKDGDDDDGDRDDPPLDELGPSINPAG